MARELGRALGSEIGKARLVLAEWQQNEDQTLVIPEGDPGLATVRALAQWILDYAYDGSDKSIPFDRPYLDLYKRCILAGRAIDAFMQKPPQDKRVRKALGTLGKILDVCTNPSFGTHVRILERRVALFEELRIALRLTPKPSRRNDLPLIHPGLENEKVVELQDIRKAVASLIHSLRQKRPQRGPAQNLRDAIDLVLHHLDVHGENLWGHAINVQIEQNNKTRLVDRTNNIIESFFHLIKRGERRRSGRKILTNDLETMPAAAALARNLEQPDYVSLLCGKLENLPQTFAGLDSEKRQQSLQQTESPSLRPVTETETIACASLPREDRILVRSEALQQKIRAAAAFRATKPPVSTRTRTIQA
jgi:hypothetical protein